MKKIYFILLLFLIFITGCNKAQTVNSIYTSDDDTYSLNVRVKYNSGSYVVFEDNTGLIAYNKKSKFLKFDEGSFVSIKGEVDNLSKVKTLKTIDEVKEGKEFSYSSTLEEVDENFITSFNNQTRYVEMSGYVDYTDNYVIHNKYIDKYLYSTNALDEDKLLSYYNRYVKVKGYIINVSNDGKYEIILSEIEESFDVGEDVETLDLHILEVNDLHGYITRDENSKNGISNLAYIVNQIRNEKEEDDCILIGNGDMFQGTAISNLTHGRAVIEAMNAMKFDAMTIGNHEFDWGVSEFVKYFDGNSSNGEATFPLLNANVYGKDDKLLTVTNGKIYESVVVEKEGIKVGIIGYIGDVYSSILYPLVQDYYFKLDAHKDILRIGKTLKDNGCDVIVVSIHGGNSSSVEAYSLNQTIANIKYNDEYLVDAIINGHTHTKQSGYIEREGVKVPIVQAKSNCEALGDIVLKINLETKKVINSVIKIHNVSDADKNYDKDVENVIQKVINENKDKLGEVYCVSDVDVQSQYDLIPYVKDVLLKATGADVVFCNNGGLRSTGDIKKGGNITIETMYKINPFDNKMIMLTLTGKEIIRLQSNGELFYGVKDNITIKENENYLVSVIDYVYYGGSFITKDDAISTDLIMRDVIIEDLKLQSTFTLNTKAKITNKVK